MTAYDEDLSGPLDLDPSSWPTVDESRSIHSETSAPYEVNRSDNHTREDPDLFAATVTPYPAYEPDSDAFGPATHPHREEYPITATPIYEDGLWNQMHQLCPACWIALQLGQPEVHAYHQPRFTDPTTFDQFGENTVGADHHCMCPPCGNLKPRLKHNPKRR